MSDASSDIQNPSPAAAHAEHPSRTGEYIRIALVLGVLTAAEVSVYYQASLHSVIAPILLTLATCKFVLVIMFYMHLKFDNKMFTVLFGGPLILALGVLIALMAIFGRVLFGG